MEWYEDPVRARDAVSAAAWRGAGRMLVVLLGTLGIAAILFPVFAQVKGGPKLNVFWVARALQQVRNDTGKWPVRFEEVAPRLKANDRLGPHRVSFVKTADQGKEAEYVIAFDQVTGVFRMNLRRVERLPEKVASGTLP